MCPVKSRFWLVKIIILLGKKFTYPYMWFSTVQRKWMYMYFLNKKTKSAIHRWGFVWVYYYYKWGFGCFSAVRVHVWPSRWPCSEWRFWLVNFKVTISSQTLSLNQLLHVFWALTLKCLLSHMMLIQIPWPTQEVITSHIHRQLHNLGRGRRSFKPYPKLAWNSSDCFESFSPLNNVWIDRPLMPSSDVTHYPKTG